MITSYAENKIVDAIFRGQSLAVPSSFYVALYLTATTEVSGGGYERVAIASSLVNWAGTQGEGTTDVSSGNTGVTSNNIAVTFPTPTADWGVVGLYGLVDAATDGNVWFFGALGDPFSVNLGDSAPEFAVAAINISVG